MEQLKVSVPKDLLDAAKAQADLEDSSLSRIVRRALRDYLQRPFLEAPAK